jgi:tight adherence protein B
MNLVPVIAIALLVALVATAALDPGRARRIRQDDLPLPTSTTRTWRRFVRVGRRRRRAIVGPAAAGAWADEIARSLRHGSTLRTALLAVVPDDDALRTSSAPLRHRLDRGATVADAADDWAGRLDERDPGGQRLVAFAAVLAAAAQLGGSAATPLERFAVTMRQHVSDELERRAQSAQAKLSARVLTMVPIAMLGVLVVIDADVRNVLHEPSGAGVVALGLLLNAAGAWWMRRILGATSTGAW